MILSQILSLVTGLATGLVTGFWFERRASRATQAHNEELTAEIARLQTALFSLGGGDYVRASPASDALPDGLWRRIVETQHADGRVSRQSIVSHFLSSGHDAADVEEALRSIVDNGLVTEQGSWLVLT